MCSTRDDACRRCVRWRNRSLYQRARREEVPETFSKRHRAAEVQEEVCCWGTWVDSVVEALGWAGRRATAMTGEEWGTGVKESGDPCSYSKEEVEKAAAAAAAAKSGEEGKRANETTTVVGGVEGERGHQQQQFTQPQEENTAMESQGEGIRVSAVQGRAQANRKEDQRGVNSSTPEGGTATAVLVPQAAGAAAQGKAEALTGRVEASATSSTLPGQGKPENKSSRGAKSGGSVGESLVAVPGRTASLPPQVLSDAIVAAYQRGYQQGLSASSTSTSAVPPSPTVAAATITSPVRGAVALSSSSSLPSSPFMGGAFVPSMGLGGSPLSSPERFGGIAAGTAGTAARFYVPHPSSPHVRWGVSPNAAASHGVATAPSPHGVEFRVPPARREAYDGEEVRRMKKQKVVPEALECLSDHHDHLTRAGVDEQLVPSKEGDDGATVDEDTYDDDDDDDDDVSVTVKKRERARLRANNRKGYIDMIAQKDGKDMTEYERNELKSWEERRDRKNNRSRERSMEKKSRIRRILDTPVEDRSDADKEFLNEYQDRRHRKNEGDRLRRERIRKMTGCGPKPRGVTVTARGPIKLPTGQVVEREEDAVAVLGHDQVKPDSKKGASRPRKRKSEAAAPTQPATGGAVVPTVGVPPFLAAGVGRNMQPPPAFFPPQSTIMSGHHTSLLPSVTALYPHFGAPILPKTSLYAGHAGYGRDVAIVPHSSLMAMHRLRSLGGIESGLGGALPYPPFVGGVGGASAGGAAHDSSAGRGPTPAAGSAPHRRTPSGGTGPHGPNLSQPPPPFMRTTTTTTTASKREGVGSQTEGHTAAK